MRYGVTLPNMGVDARTLAGMAREAEEAGWDGVFIWDCVSIDFTDSYPAQRETCDPWIALTACALQTERVRLGLMVTPLSRRRPWKVARETVSLDRLSNGRLILPVGLGAIDDGGFSKVGEEIDRKRRARLLDESLAIITGLWSGQPFSFEGEHYHLQEMTFLPTPIQQPRIPIWVVGAWRRNISLQRAFRWDGILPAKMDASGTSADMQPADIQELKALIEAERPAGAPFDIVFEGDTPGDDPASAQALVQPYAEAGTTWWLESVWHKPEAQGGLEGMRTRIRQGPPAKAI